MTKGMRQCRELCRADGPPDKLTRPPHCDVARATWRSMALPDPGFDHARSGEAGLLPEGGAATCLRTMNASFFPGGTSTH